MMIGAAGREECRDMIVVQRGRKMNREGVIWIVMNFSVSTRWPLKVLETTRPLAEYGNHIIMTDTQSPYQQYDWS